MAQLGRTLILASGEFLGVCHLAAVRVRACLRDVCVEATNLAGQTEVGWLPALGTVAAMSVIYTWPVAPVCVAEATSARRRSGRALPATAVEW